MAGLIKTCEICGRQFKTLPNGHNAKVCSDECRAIKKRRYNRAFWLLKKACRSKNICAVCGKPFDDTNRRHHFCSPACRLAYYRNMRSSWARNNQSLCRQYEKTYRRAHPHKCRAMARRRYWLNIELSRAKARQRYWRNVELRRQAANLRYPRIAIIRKINAEQEGRKFFPFCHTCGKKLPKDSPHNKYCSVECYRKSPIFRLWLRIKSQLGY